MATFDARAWTFTSGYPDGLSQTIIMPPRATQIKGLWTTAHMLMKIKACALNPVDIQMMNTLGGYVSSLSRPKTCVCDFSGSIIAGGRTGFIQHEDVFGLTLKPYDDCGGALAEMAQFNMANTVAVRKPKEWTHEQAAAIPLVWLTARTCIESVSEAVEASTSKRVAILGGSSAVGIYTIILAKRRGWKVLATSSGKNKAFVTETLGADEHCDYTTQHVRATVHPFYPAAVIDCVGGTDCVGLPSSKRYVTIVGDKTSRSSMGGPATYYNPLSYHTPIQWLRWYRGYMGWSQEKYDIIMLQMKTEWLEEAKTTLTPDQLFIDSVFKFEEAKAAFERLNTGRARGKVVIKVQD